MSKHFGTRDYIDVCRNNDDGQVVLTAGQEGYEDDELVLNLSPDAAANLAGEILGAALAGEDDHGDPIVGISIMGIRESGETVDLGCTCE